MLRDADRSNCSSALASKQQAFNAFSIWILSNIRRGEKGMGSTISDQQIAFLLTWQTFNLVATKPALLLAKRPVLTSRASSLARPRQKPEWSSYGCKHHPGNVTVTAALPEVQTPGFKHTHRFKKPWQRGPRQENETYELTPPVPAFLSSVLCLNGVLL